ncbi:MAG: iron-sulfur cluster assembly scaffold protein [candidate division WOR-3 bacterium]|nr:MAG: iron-sulfur cluster assembly scaffold protein [candidate division WOR-3 bacterium]
MKSTQYSDKVLDHFKNPRNVGTLKGDDVSVGRVGNPVCGDLMEFYVKVKDDRIEDIKFKTFGCGSAIATASMITELAKGKTVEEAIRITRQDVANELDGLPPIKMHCSNLAADALRDALTKHQKKQGPTKEQTTDSTVPGEIKGLSDFLNKGVFTEVANFSDFANKRSMVIDKGERSMEIAIELTKQTPRVIFATKMKQLPATEIADKLKKSPVRVLYESEVLEISGLNTVEKVIIHDLNEDEKYELFVDSVIVPA